MKATIGVLADTAVSKVTLLKTSKSRYLTTTMMAGFFVGLGVILMTTIGGLLEPANFAGTKVITGIAFGIALSLVLMAGADLFTGNNMIMPIGALTKKTTWYDMIQIWTASYVGNLFGSLLIAVMFFYSGMASGGTADFIVATASAKMNAPFMELLMRGIFCNILVCLAVWCTYKLKNEAAKLIMIYGCISAFITSGFEHSVANMTMLTLSLMVPHPETVTFAGMIANLVPVTIGNAIGGAVFVGAAYWFLSSEKQVQAVGSQATTKKEQKPSATNKLGELQNQ